MSQPTHTVQSAGAPFGVMLKAALGPSAVLGLITAIIVVLVRGADALPGAAFGLVVSLVFFAAGFAVLSKLVMTGNLMMMMGVALGVYLFQIIGLLIVILIVRDAAWVDRRGMGIVILVVTIAWQLFAIRALRRSRISIYNDAEADSK